MSSGSLPATKTTKKSYIRRQETTAKQKTSVLARIFFPIINNNCLSCHAGAGASSGLLLESHAHISDAAVNGRLLGIKHEPGFPAMPQSGNKLTDCQIKQFEAWVQQGALDN